MCVYSFNAVKYGNTRYGPWVTLRPSEPSAEMAKGINPNDNPDFTYVIWLTHMVKGMSSKTKIIVTNVISLIGPNFNIIVFFLYKKGDFRENFRSKYFVESSLEDADLWANQIDEGPLANHIASFKHTLETEYFRLKFEIKSEKNYFADNVKHLAKKYIFFIK